MLNLPNRLSIFRILLIPVFIGAIMYYSPQRDYLRLWAIGIFLTAILTDALDGYIARVKNQRTPLGTILDPVADKLLLITVYICLSLVKSLPPQFKLAPWTVIIVISRDVIIVLGAVVIHVMTGKLKVAPTVFGKITTFLQMATVLTLLLQLNIFPIIMYVMVFFTVLSGLDYIRIGSGFLNEATGSTAR